MSVIQNITELFLGLLLFNYRIGSQQHLTVVCAKSGNSFILKVKVTLVCIIYAPENIGNLNINTGITLLL